ncbi:phage major capsid protein [Pseudomonas gessardii]|uniref:Phage major capsid protein n=1 Tax=Pseudomonas gessardii TaxID=78544 RepID=A0ABS9FBG5_9PSED|nr:phage major capsid protein [Pseudomonas gessardii]MCF4980745.1 phage major capsid protein [Pseudomonas gessardii]MCF4988464.1 phage major capsid protein [Pseudomonas gessardii]MCF5097393.1 phage major capsid protein [Pseudomonas gessardii]MCF5109686.1 phage major capsid protein [Pseudomonas gessardii]
MDQTPKPNSGSPAPLPVLRQMDGKALQRALAVDLSTIDKENRTVEVAVSSEYPVRRWFGMEVLDHSEAAVDMTRLRAGAPFLVQHNSWSGQVGVVERAWLDESDRRLRAVIRFSRSAQAEEIWQDVVDNIRRNISVGYIPVEMVLERSESGLDHYRVTRWEPYEVSSVSVPADPTVGVGRAHEATQPISITIRGSAMDNDTNTDGQRTAPQATGSVDLVAAERQRGADIFALGDRFQQRELAQEHVAKGTTVDQFRAMILERQAPAAPVSSAQPKKGERDLPGFTTDVSARALGLTDKEMGEFSLMRAIDAAASKDWSKAGLEREVSTALADKLRKEARGFYVPHDLLMRGMSKGDPSKGGAIVANDLRIDEFIDILRNQTVMARLGMRMLGGLTGDLDLPKKISGSNFYWLAEGENVTLSDFDLTTMPLSPKTIGGGIPVTRRLRKQASRSVESLIIQDLTEGLGVAIDLGILNGPGTGNQLLGLLNQTGIPVVQYEGDTPTYKEAVSMRTKVATFNAASGNLAYLTSVNQAGLSQTTEKFPNTGRTVWEDGKVNNYKALDTNQMPDNDWLFGDFSQVVMGLWGVMDLTVDTATLAGSDGLVLRVFQDVDAGVRRKEAFCIGKKKSA